MPWNTCIHPEEETVGPTAIAGNHSANCHIISFESEKDGLRYNICYILYILRIFFTIIVAYISHFFPIDSAVEIIDFLIRLTIELLAYKEKILKEDVEVMCCRSGTPLKIVLNARVLAKDKGTPLLRNGIRSIGVEGTNEDEVSE